MYVHTRNNLILPRFVVNLALTLVSVLTISWGFHQPCDQLIILSENVLNLRQFRTRNQCWHDNVAVSLFIRCNYMRQLPIMYRMIVRPVLSCPLERLPPAARVACHTDDTNKQQLVDVIVVLAQYDCAWHGDNWERQIYSRVSNLYRGRAMVQF